MSFFEQPTNTMIAKDTEATLLKQFKKDNAAPKKKEEKTKPVYYGNFHYAESTFFTRIVAFAIIIAFLTAVFFF